ncbi:hypothetical protein CHU98_g5226 [Xylaria longipes]|nr:hypothetical protein CHU98_g5226 [Xylaria longipes]
MEFNTDLRAGFDDDFSECFSVGTQNVPSITTESTTSQIQQPYTPASGRSTPAYYSMPMERSHTDDGTSNMYFGLTPPESAFGGYFSEAKTESTPYMFANFPESPSRRSSYENGAIGFQQQQISVESTEPIPLAQYPPLNQTIPPPMELPPMPSYFDNGTYEPTPWTWPVDGPIQLFGPSEPLINGALAQDNQIPLVPTPPTHQPRHLCVNEVKQKSTALQKVQQHRVKKRKGPQTVFAYGGNWSTIEQGRFACHWPSCSGKRGFKRQEHLKRHENTVHLLQKGCKCPFCSASAFNRDDNFRTHIMLHCKMGGTGRTRYDARAPAFLAMLIANVKPRGGRTTKTTTRAKKAVSRAKAVDNQPIQLQPIQLQPEFQVITDHSHLSHPQTPFQDMMSPAKKPVSRAKAVDNQPIQLQPIHLQPEFQVITDHSHLGHPQTPFQDMMSPAIKV